MPFGLFDRGEEQIQRVYFNDEAIKDTTLDFGLYRDVDHPDENAGDDLKDSDDVSQITTEPDTANSYARQSLTLGTNTTISYPGNAQVTFDDITFDVSTNNETVNAIFIVSNYQSNELNESSASDHLFATVQLQNVRDLSLEDGTLTFTRTALQAN